MPRIGRIRRRGEVDLVFEQRDGFDLGIRLGHGHQRGVDRALLELEEQVGIGAEHQLRLQFRPPDLDADHHVRHRADGQRIERADFHVIGRVPGGLARGADAVGHGLDDVGSHIRQHVRGFGRQQVAPFVAEQGAAHAFFQRVQRAVHADRAHIQRLGGLGEVARLHVGEQDFELAQGDFFVDPVSHRRGVLRAVALTGA